MFKIFFYETEPTFRDALETQSSTEHDGEAEKATMVPSKNACPIMAEETKESKERTATALTAKSEINSFDIQTVMKTSKSKKQQTRPAEQIEIPPQHPLRTDKTQPHSFEFLPRPLSVTEVKTKTERNSSDNQTEIFECQKIQTRREQEKGSVQQSLRADETQLGGFECLRRLPERRETEKHMDTSKDYVDVKHARDVQSKNMYMTETSFLTFFLLLNRC